MSQPMPYGGFPTQMPGGMPGGMPAAMGMGMPQVNPFSMFNRVPTAPPLYVGDLDENLHDEQLHDFFSQYGPLHFVRIMRDGASGKSRGFAYVNFINPRDAETARQQAQYQKLGRKHLRIMFKRNVRDLDPGANLYVKNLDHSATVKDLHNFFSQQGLGVVSAKVSTDNEGQSLGYGYVQFERPEEAEQALANFQNAKLKENELNLTRFIPKDKRTVARKNIYVKNLPATGTQEDIDQFAKNYFTQFGEIETLAIKKHPIENKYSGFICYRNEEDAKKAYDTLTTNPPKLDGADTLYVNWHQSRSERARELKSLYAQAKNDTNLFLKNLRVETTDNDLNKVFQNFGEVVSAAAKDFKKGDQVIARMGYVAFKTHEEAENALAKAKDHPDVKAMFIPTAQPYVGMHQTAESRRQYLASKNKWKKAQQPQNPPMMPFGNRNFQALPPFLMGGGNQMFRRGGPQRGGPGQQQPWRKGGQFQQGGPKGGMGGAPRGQNRPPMDRPPHHQERNQAPRNNMGMGSAPQQMATAPQPQGGITIGSLRQKLSDFLALDQDKQRQILGELLFPKVREISSDHLAPKITGMLVDLSVLEVTEILDFLEDPTMLQERVTEAVDLIQSEGL